MASNDAARTAMGKAIGRVPSGVFVLTCAQGDQRMAMLASWIQQAAFEPPAISVAVAKERPIGDRVKQGKRFAVSVLGQGDSALMKKYARGIEPSEDPFEGVSVIETPDGQPVLADGVAWLDCRLISVCDFGADHELFVAEVIGGDVLKEDRSFMHQRGTGFHY